MKKILSYLAIAAALAACHGGGSSGTLQRKDQQQYDVVQEGQASGVTSTINAPGEVAPPPAPMTGTNADTTSNFTLPQVAPTGTMPGQPGTLAGQMPQPSTPGSMTSSYPSAPPRPRTTAPRTEPARTEPQRHTEAPRTDTTGTMTEGPPPSTNTAPPKTTTQPNTDTAPPPPPSNDTQPPPSTTTT